MLLLRRRTRKASGSRVLAWICWKIPEQRMYQWVQVPKETSEQMVSDGWVSSNGRIPCRQSPTAARSCSSLTYRSPLPKPHVLAADWEGCEETHRCAFDFHNGFIGEVVKSMRTMGGWFVILATGFAYNPVQFRYVDTFGCQQVRSFV